LPSVIEWLSHGDSSNKIVKILHPRKRTVKVDFYHETEPAALVERIRENGFVDVGHRALTWGVASLYTAART
jgi:hypothetical protein